MNTSETKDKTENKETWCRDYQGKEYSFEEFISMAEKFHGFGAPGLVLGGCMVSFALKNLPRGCIFDAVCETESCLPDAIQLLTLCSTGNGWMKVKDFGRFALTLFDKYTGEGVRVYLDPEKLNDYPEFKSWFFRLKPKKEQDFELLMKNIRDAHEGVLGIERVEVEVSHDHNCGPNKTVICTECGESYPEAEGDVCAACAGQAYYRKAV